jgi:hypothetical protein
MKYLSVLLIFFLFATAGGGCRMCDNCYPLGGLIGKSSCDCENCSLQRREGSIVDAPVDAAATVPGAVEEGTQFQGEVEQIPAAAQ